MPTICIEPVDSIQSFDVSSHGADTKITDATTVVETKTETNGELTTVPKISPNHSICSQNISITTLDTDDAASSIAESDDEYDDGNEVASLPGGLRGGSEVVLMSRQSDGGDECVVASASSATVRPNIGSIAVQNSSDITFGNKTFYQGPVTIKQYIKDKDKNKWTPSDKANDNPNFVTSNGDLAKGEGDFFDISS